MSNSKSIFVKIIKEICDEEHIVLTSYSSDWVFQLRKDEKAFYIYGYQFGINPDSISTICYDKSTTSSILTSFGIPNVEHLLFASTEEQHYIGKDGCWSELLELLREKEKLVIKPNNGTGGNEVFKVSNFNELESAVHTLFNKNAYIAVSPYYNILNEYRVIILDYQIKLVYVKQRPCLIGDGVSTVAELLIQQMLKGKKIQFDTRTLALNPCKILKKGDKLQLGWKHNLGLNSYAVILSECLLKKNIEKIALDAAKCIGVRFSSIDVVDTREGLKILEINSGVMMENFANQDSSNYSIAKSIYREAILKMFDQRTSNL